MHVDNKDLGVGPAKGWKENRLWALVHDVIAHPIMGITLYSNWAVNFHKWTGDRAWQPLHNLPPML